MILKRDKEILIKFINNNKMHKLFIYELIEFINSISKQTYDEEEYEFKDCIPESYKKLYET